MKFFPEQSIKKNYNNNNNNNKWKYLNSENILNNIKIWI